MRRALALCAICLAALPAAAEAATVKGTPVSPGFFDATLAYDALPGETNHVTVTAETPTVFLVTDTGAPLTPSGSCTAVNANEARCDLGPAHAEIVLGTLGDGNDSFAIDTTAVYGNVSGGPGDDAISGACTAMGGPGSDTIQLCSNALPGATYADGGPGDDVVNGGSEGDILHGGGGRDRLNGGPGDDYLQSDDGLSGLPIDDDSLDGGPGSDTVSWIGHTRPTRIDLEAGSGGQAGETDTLTGIENVIAGSGPDTILGTDAANRISGGAGSDRIMGRGGDDSIIDGPGADRVDAGPGDDTLNSRDLFADRIACGPGSDQALSERGDRVAADCEHRDVQRVRLNFQKRLNLHLSGIVYLSYNCLEPPAGVEMENFGECPGLVVLRLREHHRWIVAGSARCTKRCPGLFPVRMRRAARAALRRAHRLPAKITFTRAPGRGFGALPETDRLEALATHLR